jgi:hypothetical protein
MQNKEQKPNEPHLPDLYKADVSRSAEYTETLRMLNKALTAGYCRLLRGELDEWLDEAGYKIQALRELNKVT